MGEQNVNRLGDNDARSIFIQHLIKDVEALELMLQKNLIEDDIVRIGAEQEFCLVDQNWRPTNNSDLILEKKLLSFVFK